MKKRPKIKLKLSVLDYMLEILGMVGLLGLIVLPFIFYRELPDRIPKHFNAMGIPDSYGAKGSIWVLPIIGFVIFSGFTLLNKFPHIFSYPVTVTDENAERIYTIGTKALRLLKVFLMALFLYLNYKTIEIGLQQTEKLSSVLFLILPLAVLVMSVFTIFKMIKK